MGRAKWLPFVLLAGGLGCTSLAELDGDYVVGDTSTGSTTSSGTGGTASGTGGSTSGTGGTTSGTGGSTSGTGGGTGGVGGTTSGGGGGGGTGPEDCLDGQDNNGDNLADCADPLCQTDYECVPDVTQLAWVGYFETTSTTFPAPGIQPCADSSTPQVSYGGPGGPATCDACTCGNISGSCTYPQMGLWGNANSCSGSPTISYTPTDNNCHNFGVGCQDSCSNDQRVQITQQSMPISTVCPASGGGATVPPLWSDEHHTCPLPPAGVGCSSGSVCVPKQSCVQQQGNHACPAEWPTTLDAFGGAVDTRGCSSCVCATATSCPGGKITIYDDGSCQGGYTPSFDLTGTSCDSAQNHLDYGGASFRAYAGTFTGSCTPGGGQPDGTVAPSEPLTICCR